MNINKIYKIFKIAIFSLILFNAFKSCSYAYSVDDFINFTAQVREDVSNFNKSTGVILNNQNGLRNLVDGYNFTTFICTNANYTQSFEACQLIARGSPVKVNVTIGNVVLDSAYRDKSQWYEISYFNGWSIQRATYNPRSFSNTTTFGLLDLDNQEVSNWFNNWFNDKYVPPYTGPEFEIANNGKINVYYQNNLIENANRLPFGYVFPDQATLGYITNYDDNFYGFEGRFGPLVGYDSDNNMITDSTFASFNYTSFYGLNKKNLDFDFSTGRVSVKNVSLIPNQLYYLTLFYKETYDSDWVEMTDVFIPYYAYFYNNVLSSGDAISPDLNSSIDIDFINSFNEITHDSGNSQHIINSMFPYSGDLYSGDFLGVSYNDYDDFGFGDFVSSFFNNLVTVLSSYENVTINFGFLGDISSSQFSINNNVVSTFIGLFSTVFFIIIFIMFYYRLIKSMSTLDLTSIFKYDVDSLFNLF